MRFILKKNSLKSYFFKSTFIIFLIAVIVFMIVMFAFSYQAVYRDYSEHISNQQRKMLNSTELIINSVNFSSVELLMNNNIYKTISSEDISNEKKEDIIKGYLSAPINNNSVISDTVLITYDNTVYRVNETENYLPSSLFLSGIDYCTTSTYVELSEDPQHKYFVIGRQFKNFNTGKNIGYLLIYLDIMHFSELYNTEADETGSQTLLVNNENTIIAHPDETMIGEKIFPSKNTGFFADKINNEKKFISITPFSEELKNAGFNWQIITLVDSASMMSIAFNSANIALKAGIAALLLALGLSLLIVYSTLRPVNRLQNAMKFFKNKKSQLKPRNGKFDEIIQLENDYIDMTNRVEALIKENRENMDRQRELELTALQAQINPHFLYNTLDVTIWIAKIKKEPEIEKIISSLANFFRMSLHNGDKYITIKEEIALVNSYIAIEQIRFPHELDMQYNIEPSLMEQKILKLTLQPFVENALKHGLRGLSSKRGNITINGIKHGENIIFEVIDNGKGFNIQSLDFQNTDNIGSGGYGIKNVHERLVLEYGKKYGISIFSEPNHGTRVIIKVRQTDIGSSDK